MPDGGKDHRLQISDLSFKPTGHLLERLSIDTNPVEFHLCQNFDHWHFHLVDELPQTLLIEFRFPCIN